METFSDVCADCGARFEDTGAQRSVQKLIDHKSLCTKGKRLALLCCMQCELSEIGLDLERLKEIAQQHRVKNPGHEPRWDVPPKVSEEMLQQLRSEHL